MEVILLLLGEMMLRSFQGISLLVVHADGL
jgi:hypothetical protein